MLSEQQLFDLFSRQHHWQDRYRQLILLSRQLDDLPDEQKTDNHQVKGCENKLWLTAHKEFDGTFTFQGDSEGRIVKGLLAVLIILTNGKTQGQIEKIDFQGKLKQLNVTDELSATRLSGLMELISRIKQLSAEG